MSFSGKKYRRIGCENVDKLIKSYGDEHLANVLRHKSPIFSYTRIYADTYHFYAEADKLTFEYTFKLGQEFELERIDGKKTKVIYTLHGENIMKKIVKQPDGKILHIEKELGEHNSSMTVWLEGSHLKAKVFYEIIK